MVNWEGRAPCSIPCPQQEGTLHRFGYSPQEAFPWSRAQDGPGEPQAGSVFGAPSLHLPRGLGKPHLALGISWEGRRSTELLGGFLPRLPREGAGSVGQGENTPGTSGRARETVWSVGVGGWVIKMSPFPLLCPLSAPSRCHHLWVFPPCPSLSPESGSSPQAGGETPSCLGTESQP